MADALTSGRLAFQTFRRLDVYASCPASATLSASVVTSLSSRRSRAQYTRRVVSTSVSM